MKQKYIFIVPCIIVFLMQSIGLDKQYIGFSLTSSLCSHFTFMLVHRNLYHLFMNMLVYYQLFNVVGKKVGSDAALVIPLFISFAASFLCEYSLPTIGASGLVYALTGMFFMIYRLETKTYIFNAAILSISGTIGYFTHVNVKLHLICFVFGILSGVVLNENIFGRLLKWFKRPVC